MTILDHRPLQGLDSWSAVRSLKWIFIEVNMLNTLPCLYFSLIKGRMKSQRRRVSAFLSSSFILPSTPPADFFSEFFLCLFWAWTIKEVKSRLSSFLLFPIDQTDEKLLFIPCQFPSRSTFVFLTIWINYGVSCEEHHRAGNSFYLNPHVCHFKVLGLFVFLEKENISVTSKTQMKKILILGVI